MFDVTYILVIIGAVICMIASARVNSTYSKYARIQSSAGMTGAQAAQCILERSGVTDVSVGHVSGNLTDHFDPSKMVVNLSDATYASTSVAAIGVAAHECGHVMQHHTGYAPLAFRAALVPIANIGSNMGLPMVILGLILGVGYTNSGALTFGGILCDIGIALFCFGVLFQLVTLPVEFDASSRGLKMLEQYNILNQNELPYSRAVLHAAAMTYVAAAASSILQMLRLLLLVSGGRRRSD
ncbi:MAG: zinc metallopeptidase [Lachnospiraceae bacterium]|jgi:Zn-dependent membrane protease YugP|nr:zinc metallopeptidase [Lachnospiraceae bacterium]